jgi:acyl dehydratase
LNDTNTQGPGIISADDVGHRTIATTTLLDARKTMAYAAGINDANPAYFDDTRDDGLLIHPGICFSLQWKSRFQIDRKPNLRAAPYGVHAYTDLRMHRPFRQGEAITTQGTTVGRRQIAPGTYTMERYLMTSSSGDLVAELDYNGIIRGGQLDGPDVVLEEEIPRPMSPATDGTPLWASEVFIPLHLGQQYTECADIYNPIHTEPSVAKAAGLPDIILHGSATKAIALSEVINRSFNGDARPITRLCGQLRGMVLMNSTIKVECMADKEEAGIRTIFFRVLNQEGQAAIANGVIMGK